MPELPEVETIKRVIEPQIRGLSIQRVIIHRPEVIAYPEAEVFAEKVMQQIVASMERRGKFLTIVLESGDRMTLHLRMTGSLMFTPPDFPLEKHTHIILQMDNGWELRFTDQRRFGRFWYLQAGEADTYTGIAKLGKEPFDATFDSTYLRGKLGKRKKAIKECLLDQSVIAGIGNIYGDEILYESKIYPLTPANALTEAQWETLAVRIPERLEYFIEKNSITQEDYLAGKGKDYRNTPYLQVYGKGGKECPKCKEPLCRVVIGGRSCVYCPKCQKE